MLSSFTCQRGDSPISVCLVYGVGNLIGFHFLAMIIFMIPFPYKVMLLKGSSDFVRYLICHKLAHFQKIPLLMKIEKVMVTYISAPATTTIELLTIVGSLMRFWVLKNVVYMCTTNNSRVFDEILGPKKCGIYVYYYSLS